MKATEQCFPVVLLLMLYKVVLYSEFVDKNLKCDHSNASIDQYFPVMLFIMPRKVVPYFAYEDRNLKCDHSNESY